MSGGGCLVVSLDFELLWGILDKDWRDAYRPNVLAGREAIPRMLELFERKKIHATWACVGLALCSGRDEALSRLGTLSGRRAASGLSLGEYVARHTGRSEAEDPVHYVPSLIRAVTSTPGQEIGSHTFSHYYCMEEGANPEAFRSDLKAFHQLALERKIGAASLVLPRNQVRSDFLPVMAQEGVRAYRGTPPGSLLDGARAEERQSIAIRALRLAEAYFPAARRMKEPARPVDPTMPRNVPASRFFRPCLTRSPALEGLRAAKIEAEMERAARTGGVYHLWWHPHNMGTRPELAMALLERVLERYARLGDERGFRSLTMGEAAAEMGGRAG